MIPFLPALTAVITVIVLLSAGAVFLFRYRKDSLAAAVPAFGRTKPVSVARAGVLLSEMRPTFGAEGRSELVRVSGLSMPEAEDLLDWLENNGFPERHVVVEQDSFAVEYRVDAAHKQPTLPHLAWTKPAQRSSAS